MNMCKLIPAKGNSPAFLFPTDICIVLDQLKITIAIPSSKTTLFLVICLFLSKEDLVSGTKLDFLAIKKKANKNKHQTRGLSYALLRHI
jgi:hypothetical protein